MGFRRFISEWAWFGSVVILAFSHAWSAEETWKRADFEKEVLVIRQTKGSAGLGGAQGLEREEKRPLTADEKQVYDRLDDGRWRVFQDEFVRFEVPDDPLLKIEVLKPQERSRIRIVGDALSTNDNRYARAYRMTVGALPYGVLLVAEADWFDDGLCLCGAIALKRLVMREGTLLEFSLLHEGKVKKVQALGAKHRAVLFEWTHSAITPEAYARIGASIRLAQPSTRTREEWIGLTRKHRPKDTVALVGWLNPGAAEAELASVLGEPARRTKGQWVYENEEWDEDGDGARFTVSLPIRDGRFATPLDKFQKYKDLPPRPGTLAWAEATVEEKRDNDKAPPLAPETVKSVFEKARKALASPLDSERWNDWCMVIYEMAELEHRDDSVRPLAKARFLEKGLNQHYASWVLHKYPQPENEDLFRQRLEIVLKDCEGPKKERMTDPHETWNLLVFMELKEPASLDILRRALKHSDATVRSSAYGSGESLPSAEARLVARHAIETEDNEHGITMATYLIRDTGIEEDLEWLTAAKERYTNKRTMENWSDAIEAIKERARK